MSALVIAGLLMGLFGGVHCAAMCGGLVGVLCGAAPRCQARAVAPDGARRAAYLLAYNAGRVGAYVILGLIVGGLGALSSGWLSLEPLRLALRAVAALSMLAVGLHLAGFPSFVRALESLGGPLWLRIAPLTKRFVPLRRAWHALVLGSLWGLMPCGLLYGALTLAASAASPFVGAATMAAFGAGTLPVMLTMGAAAETVSRLLARRWVRRAAGGVVLAFGVWSTLGVASQVGVGDALGVLPRRHCCPTR